VTVGSGADGDASNRSDASERVLRRATPADANAIAAVLTAARARQAFIPPLHTPDDDRRFVSDVMLPSTEVWVVEEAGMVVGFASFGEDVLGHLYVAPEAQRRGIGRVLLDTVKARRPDGFTLWTHQPNAPGRAFYDRQGLIAVEFTDGAANEEKVPDVRYVWQRAEHGSQTH
jgi:ribosomal protein S18 acetylase RimI-like enzyme